MVVKYWCYSLGFITGNFVYELFRSMPNWERAFEISYSQLWIIGFIYFMVIRGWAKKCQTSN